MSKVIDAEIAPKDRRAGHRGEHVLPAEPRTLQAGRQRPREPHPDSASRRTATPAQRTEAKAKAQAALKEIRAGGRLRRDREGAVAGSRQRAERRRSRLFPKGQMNAAVRGRGVRDQDRQRQPGGRNASSAIHIIKVHERRGAADGAADRGRGADQGLPDAGSARAEAGTVCRAGQGQGQGRDSRLTNRADRAAVLRRRSGETGRRAGLKIP